MTSTATRTPAADGPPAAAGNVPPRAPFSSFNHNDVTYLLTDLTGLVVPLPGWRRDALIRAGRAPADLLVMEGPADGEAVRLYRRALVTSTRLIARAVGVVAERILATSPVPPVLVSLARAGTPAGILLRRWVLWRHGWSLPHYTISLIRGRGIDCSALRYLVQRHDPQAIRFVDGWTGKGAIACELLRSLSLTSEPGVRLVGGALAALVDPGHYAAIRGTDDDVLVPTASLNATACGLLGGIVLDRIGPNDFHGAVWHPELADQDVSVAFVEAIAGQFASVSDVDVQLDATAATHPPSARRATEEVRALAEAHGVTDLNLVKPGVNETVRALFYRNPRLLLVTGASKESLQHVLALARRRGIAVEQFDSDVYTCACVISPTGAY